MKNRKTFTLYVADCDIPTIESAKTMYRNISDVFMTLLKKKIESDRIREIENTVHKELTALVSDYRTATEARNILSQFHDRINTMDDFVSCHEVFLVNMLKSIEILKQGLQ